MPHAAPRPARVSETLTLNLYCGIIVYKAVKLRERSSFQQVHHSANNKLAMKFISFSLHVIGAAAIFIAHRAMATPVPAGKPWLHNVLLRMTDRLTVENICNTQFYSEVFN